MAWRRAAGLLALTLHAATGSPPVPKEPRSSMRWLSFYNGCAWGLHNTTTVAEPPPASAAGAGASTGASAGGRSHGFVGLPLIEGTCVRPSACSTPHACDRGMCWLDQLETTQRHNSSSMLLLETSGPVFCGRTGCAGCLYVCPDDCTGAGGPHPELNYSDASGFRGPGAGTCGLEWIRRTTRWAKPLVAAGHLSGFMLGDELSGGMNVGNCELRASPADSSLSLSFLLILSLSTDTAITDVIHTELEGVEHFVYTNESPHMYLGDKVPSGIDVISFDGYGICKPPGEFCGGPGPRDFNGSGVNKSEAKWHQSFYESAVYPHLMPHQRVAVVPGFFGCALPDQPGGCERNASLGRERCLCAISGEDLSQEGQTRHLIQKVDEYFAWAAEDPKLVGMAPWHYGNRPSSMALGASGCGHELGQSFYIAGSVMDEINQ